MTRFGPLAALVCGAALLAGCGGSSGPKIYTVAKTRACLVDKGVRVGPPRDFVASTATGGSLLAHVPRNTVTVAFGATQSDADNIDAAYVSFAAKNVGVADILRQQDNAVMLWRMHPSDADLALVTGCLR